MEWIHDIKGQQYEQLLKILFTHCDTVQCIVIEDVGDYFEEIAYECLEKKYVTQWPLTSLGHAAVPVLQYTFLCHYNTEQFFKRLSNRRYLVGKCHTLKTFLFGKMSSVFSPFVRTSNM